MLGAIIGDLAGTKYEYQEFLDWKNRVINLERRRKILDLNEPLLTDKSFISDDSILTIAVAEAILNKWRLWRGKDPTRDKSEFVLSLCEQIMENNTSIRSHKLFIDRCVRIVYSNYKQRNYQVVAPTLEDFRKVLLQQPEREEKDNSLSIELFTKGSLNTFAKQTNVEVDNRLICYDIIDLGSQLMPVLNACNT